MKHLILLIIIALLSFSCESPKYIEDDGSSYSGGETTSKSKSLSLILSGFDVASAGGADTLREGDYTYIAVLHGKRFSHNYYSSLFYLSLFTIHQGKIDRVNLKVSNSIFYKTHSNKGENNFIRIFRKDGILSILYLSDSYNLILMKHNYNYWTHKIVRSDVGTFTIDKTSGSKVALSDGWNYFYCSNIAINNCYKIPIKNENVTLNSAFKLFHNESGEPIIITLFGKDSWGGWLTIAHKRYGVWRIRATDYRVNTRQVVGAVVDQGRLKICVFESNKAHYWEYSMHNFEYETGYSIEIPSKHYDRCCYPNIGYSDELTIFSPYYTRGSTYHYSSLKGTYTRVRDDIYQFYFDSDKLGKYSIYSHDQKLVFHTSAD